VVSDRLIGPFKMSLVMFAIPDANVDKPETRPVMFARRLPIHLDTQRPLVKQPVPHSGSVKDQPKLSSISRNTVRHHPKTKRQPSTEVIHFQGSPLSGLNR
jgi:hypothetical protein